MLETSEERVVLLKAGISGKEIEQLYIIYNNLKIVVKPVLFETAHNEENNNGGDKASAECHCS
jgi:hypothetical protein